MTTRIVFKRTGATFDPPSVSSASGEAYRATPSRMAPASSPALTVPISAPNRRSIGLSRAARSIFSRK
jgi:hypothetical protein